MKKKNIKHIALLTILFIASSFANAVAEERLAPPVLAPDNILDIDNEVLFDRVGTIDFCGDGFIRIDGLDLEIADSYRVQFFDSSSAKPIVLKIGMFVGYIVNNDNKVIAVWVIKPEDKSKALELLEKKKLIE